MKLKQEIDLTAIITTLGFIVAMIVWGIRLEGKVSSNTDEQTAFEKKHEKVQKLLWDNNNAVLDRMRRDIYVLENQLRSRDEGG